jgi:hypothetical protein
MNLKKALYTPIGVNQQPLVEEFFGGSRRVHDNQLSAKRIQVCHVRSCDLVSECPLFLTKVT